MDCIASVDLLGAVDVVHAGGIGAWRRCSIFGDCGIGRVVETGSF